MFCSLQMLHCIDLSWVLQCQKRPLKCQKAESMSLFCINPFRFTLLTWGSSFRTSGLMLYLIVLIMFFTYECVFFRVMLIALNLIFFHSTVSGRVHWKNTKQTMKKQLTGWNKVCYFLIQVYHFLFVYHICESTRI